MRQGLLHIPISHDIAILLLRIGVGIVFIFHGWMKFENLEMTKGFFVNVGLPSVLVYIIATIELIGGIAILFGLFTDIASILLAFVMAGAILFVQLKSGFSGFEFELVLLLSSLAIAFSSPGKYNLKNAGIFPTSKNS